MLRKIMIAFVSVVLLSLPAQACDLQADFAELSHMVPDGRVTNEAWFNIYSKQFADVMTRANQGDTAGACQAMDDLIVWVHNNPAPH